MEKEIVKVGVLIVGNLVSSTNISWHHTCNIAALGKASYCSMSTADIPEKIETQAAIYDTSNAVIIKGLAPDCSVKAESIQARANSVILATGNIIAMCTAKLQ